MIELQNASKRYGETVALQPVDLRIGDGRTTVLIGESGSGKSTLLRLLNGLIWPDSGTVTVDDTPVRPETVREIRTRMGYMIQEGGLFPHMSARRNVTLMARQLRWSEERIRTRVEELSELVRFPGDGLERYPVELSGGQRQRVSLMRALMLDPKVLLLDEPLGALDPVTRSDIQSDLRVIFERLKKTVVMVTHDLGEAAYFADRVVLLHEGRLVQAGRIEEMMESPAEAFVTRFIQAQRSFADALEELGRTPS